MSQRYLALDLETGGLSCTDSDILTAYFAVLDENFHIQAELELKIKPDGLLPYRVTADALRVNGINLIKHNQEAMSLSDAIAELKDFLKKYRPQGRDVLIPLGHNVVFDIRFICTQMMTQEEWKHFCGFNNLDTQQIAHFMSTCGLLPGLSRLSLQSLVDYLKVPQMTAHNAKYDTLMTVLAFKELRKIAISGKRKTDSQ